MDLSYLEAFMGGAAEETTGGGGGVWVVGPDGVLDEGLLRLVGKARVVADALGSYVTVLLTGGGESAQRAVGAGADSVLLASGTPSLGELTDFLRERAPKIVLLPRSTLGRTLGPGLAETLGGSLCGYAADLAVDPIYNRVLAHQPVLDDAARLVIAALGTPAIVLVDTAALPAAYNEPWRSGAVEDASVAWGATADTAGVPADLPAAPLTLANAPVIVAAGRGLGDAAGFRLAEKLAARLGGLVAGDLGALDAGWINEGQLVGLTGASVAPRLYLALGIDGDTSQFMATAGSGMIVAVQADPTAPIVPVADVNIIANPVQFAEALLAAL